jgi:phage tail tape-measure protein
MFSAREDSLFGDRSGFGRGAVLAMVRAGKAGDLTRHGVAMECALTGGLAQHAGRLAQFLRGAGGVGTLYCLDGLLDCAMYAGFYRTVAIAPFEALAMAFLG